MDLRQINDSLDTLTLLKSKLERLGGMEPPALTLSKAELARIESRLGKVEDGEALVRWVEGLLTIEARQIKVPLDVWQFKRMTALALAQGKSPKEYLKEQLLLLIGEL